MGKRKAGAKREKRQIKRDIIVVDEVRRSQTAPIVIEINEILKKKFFELQELEASGFCLQIKKKSLDELEASLRSVYVLMRKLNDNEYEKISCKQRVMQFMVAVHKARSRLAFVYDLFMDLTKISKLLSRVLSAENDILISEEAFLRRLQVDLLAKEAELKKKSSPEALEQILLAVSNERDQISYNMSVNSFNRLENHINHCTAAYLFRDYSLVSKNLNAFMDRLYQFKKFSGMVYPDYYIFKAEPWFTEAFRIFAALMDSYNHDGQLKFAKAIKRKLDSWQINSGSNYQKDQVYFNLPAEIGLYNNVFSKLAKVFLLHNNVKLGVPSMGDN